jgi:hypothetical protein
MTIQDYLVGRRVLIVWTSVYRDQGAQSPSNVRVLEIGDGLMYLQEERDTEGEVLNGTPFWVPVAAIEHMTEG